MVIPPLTLYIELHFIGLAPNLSDVTIKIETSHFANLRGNFMSRAFEYVAGIDTKKSYSYEEVRWIAMNAIMIDSRSIFLTSAKWIVVSFIVGAAGMWWALKS